MKKITENLDDELLPEYDFSKLQIVARGPGRKRAGEVQITLAADVAKKFPTSESVNEALRLIIKVADTANKPHVSR